MGAHRGSIAKNRAIYGGGIYVEVGSSFTKRAISGSNISSISYGSTGENANSGSGGNAIYAYSLSKKRNSTLNANDEISTLTDEGWE